MAALLAIPWALSCQPAPPGVPSRDYPIIDMHLHALPANSQGPAGGPMCLGGAGVAPWDQREPFRGPAQVMLCADTTYGGQTDEAIRDSTFAILERENVIGVTSGRDAAEWHRLNPGRIVTGILTGFGGLTPDALEARLDADSVEVFAEITVQYRGLSPSAPEVAPHFAVAAERDLPVGIHLALGPPGAPMFLGLRMEAGNPAHLEDLLLRHPRMRVYIMHAGWPYIDEMIGMMALYPQLYVSFGVLGTALPEPEYYRILQRFLGAGMGKRMMFGSDQMVWPETLTYQINMVENAPFLNLDQKRDIFFANARRFLRMEDDPRLAALMARPD